jgi:hypothetical protein
METDPRWRVSAASAAEEEVQSRAAAAEVPAELNPWRTIWFSPRVTVRYLIDAEEPPGWVPVFALGTIGSLLDTVNTWWHASAGQLFQNLALATLFGILGIWLGPVFMAFYGRRRGGVGRSNQIRVAYAWSSVPIVVGAVGWLPLWLAGGVGYEMNAPGDSSTLGLDLIHFGILATFVWNLVILVAGIAEIHRFSVWRAIETVIGMTVAFAAVYFACVATFGLETVPPRRAAVVRDSAPGVQQPDLSTSPRPVFSRQQL